jgi:hypothetical protein
MHMHLHVADDLNLMHVILLPVAQRGPIVRVSISVRRDAVKDQPAGRARS